MINMAKIYKFFSKGAIKHSKDAWWDANTLSIITKANQEMTNIFTFDSELIFPETRVEIDMPGFSNTSRHNHKVTDDLLSTGSISTFRMTATRAMAL